MLNMTWQSIESLLRNILQFGGGYVVGAGLLSGEQWTLLTGIIMGVGSFIWSLVNKNKLLTAPAD